MRFSSCVAVLLLLMLAGCGQKGALYLPDQNRTAIPVTPETPTTATPDGDKPVDKPAARRTPQPL
jgi:predicted small lipoprotein YifL